MLIDESVRSFLDGLGSAEPVPGGGAASALAGAVAANLFKMVVTLTEAKEADKRELLAPVRERLQVLCGQLAELVDRDAQAYQRVRHAYAMPKDAEDLRIKRAMEIQLALREATVVPLEVIERVVETVEVASEVARHGRASAISDAGTGNFMALAAAMGALLNVQVNLQGIDDAAFVEPTAARAGELVERCQALFEQVRERVTERLEEA